MLSIWGLGLLAGLRFWVLGSEFGARGLTTDLCNVCLRLPPSRAEAESASVAAEARAELGANQKRGILYDPL